MYLYIHTLPYSFWWRWMPWTLGWGLSSPINYTPVPFLSLHLPQAKHIYDVGNCELLVVVLALKE